MNGSICTVQEIVYDNPLSPNLVGRLPLYIAIYFPESTINEPMMHGSPPTCILVHVIADRCEKNVAVLVLFL